MIFGLILIILAVFYAINIVKSVLHDTTAVRHREVSLVLIAGLLWFDYGLLSDAWVVGVAGLITFIAGLIVSVMLHRERFDVIAAMSTIVGVLCVVINILLPIVPVTIVGWTGLAFVVAAVVSFIHGYATKREGLYPVAGGMGFGLLLFGLVLSLHAMAEIMHLIPLFVGLSVIILSIPILLPVVFPALNRVGEAVLISSDPTSTKNYSFVDRNKVEEWARNLQKEADETKAAQAEEKRKKKEK